jgi:type IV secretory pathway TrbL component
LLLKDWDDKGLKGFSTLAAQHFLAVAEPCLYLLALGTVKVTIVVETMGGGHIGVKVMD